MVLLAIVALIIFFLLYAATVIASSPRIDPDNIYANLSESSILYDDEGNVMENIYRGDGNRINVDYDQIPKNMINAIVSIEDKTFWDHHGFNFVRMLGAIRESIFSGGQISGTSTITQQLARNVYLPETKSVRSLNRKISEAWYTVLLERKLSKKQIMEAYLNTIYFGYNAYGVQAASQAYFSKDVEDLDLAQCIALASIPKSPEYYSLVRTLDNNTIESEALKLKKKDILSQRDGYTIVYNGDNGAGRRRTTAKYMEQQGYIDPREAYNVEHTDLISELDLDDNVYRSRATYFADYVVEQVISDLEKQGYTSANARKMVYTGGLRIHTTMNSRVQQAVDTTFENDANFPQVTDMRRDSHGNILNKSGGIMLYRYRNLINSKGLFKLRPGDFSTDDQGNIILRSGRRLTFYKTKTEGKKDYAVEIRDMYSTRNGIVYSIQGSTLLIPRQYKKMNSDGDLVVSLQYMKDNPGIFIKSGDAYYISEDGYSLGQRVQQPQGAMVVTDFRNGDIKAMTGGRDTTGKMLYNRAQRTRQPGSSIKPLSVYSTALQQGADAAKENKPMKFKRHDKNDIISLYGKYWTASSRINDAPLTINGRVWPHNAYGGYRGLQTLRQSVEQSINVNAVRVFQQIGPADAIEQLHDFGITSVVENGSTNDRNAAALALGGMTKGVSPIEMASAYGVFPNSGVYVKPRVYTTVTDKHGDTLLETGESRRTVLDKGVAFIMTDILRTTVTSGIARDAQTSQPTAGKTGTTSDKYDAWFCGFTPQYSAACWLGSDLNMELDEGSPAAARLWQKVMEKATSGLSGSFPSQPSTVVRIGGEYFVKGTESGAYFFNFNWKKNTQQKKRTPITFNWERRVIVKQ